MGRACQAGAAEWSVEGRLLLMFKAAWGERYQRKMGTRSELTLSFIFKPGNGHPHFSSARRWQAASGRETVDLVSLGAD